MKKTHCLRWLSVIALVATVSFSGAADAAKKSPFTLAVATERSTALYQRGEPVTFVVRLEKDGVPVEQGEVAWAVTKDGVEPRTSGTVAIEKGRGVVRGKLDEAGFLQCGVSFQAEDTRLTANAGAGVSPLEIRPSMPAPDDFDAFWAGKKKQLAAVPMNPQLTPVKSPTESVLVFDLQAESVGAPVSGYFARPKDARPGGHPAILTVHGAGVRSSVLTAASSWAREGALALDINAHGLPNGKEKEFYDRLAESTLKDYRRAGRESRETVYFLGMFLRLVRAIDFLTSQPEWDGRTVVVSGSSQGGAQAIVAAGLDSRVTFFVAGVPAMCDHTGALAGRIAGWPKFIETKETPSPEVVAAVRYYDAVNFTARTKAPGFFTVGFIDTTCPPTSVFAAYNALTSKKEIFHDIAAGHTNTPAASAAMREAVKAHFAQMKKG